MNAPDEHGLLATTPYAPRLRPERSEMLAQQRWMAPGLKGLARGRRAIANWDEVGVTMAVETVRALLRARVVPVAELTLASTTLPFAQRLNAGIVAAAIGLREGDALREVGSCARAALAELAAALRRTAEGPTIVVAAERRVAKPASAQEMIQGDGAAAALIGRGDAVATFVAHHGRHADRVNYFREAGRDHDYGCALQPNRKLVTIKVIEPSVSNGEETGFQAWDGANIQTAREALTRAYAAAGITDPRRQIGMAEVHDCFSVTETMLMEDLGFSAPGHALHDVLDGVFDRQGALPVQPDGGLKCFGHPIGASPSTGRCQRPGRAGFAALT